jgi:hypothetical protein
MADVWFRAPWGHTLIAVSLLTSLLLVAIFLMGILTASRPLTEPLLIGALPVAILAIAALFTVRGYILTERTLEVQRLVWNTSLSLNNLQSVEYRPDAMSHSLRTWGNGGLFSFTGHFRNSDLGAYRAFVTDLEHTVVLTFPDRKIVLSPENPGEFVDSVLQRRADVS